MNLAILASDNNLFSIINHIHKQSYLLSKKILNTYYPNAGNLGIFCQNENEYENFIDIQQNLVKPSDNPNLKYFELLEPIVLAATKQIPQAVYTHLYIRKPDPTPYGQFRGDIDFYTDKDKFNELINSVKSDSINGAELYEQKGVGTLIELSDIATDVVAYISTEEITEKIRVRH